MSALRIAVATALIGAAVVFAIGVSIERSQGDHHDTTTTAQQGAGQPTPAGPEGSAAREQQEGASPGGSTTNAADVHAAAEKLFGVKTESNWVVAVAFAVAIVLAAAILVRPSIAVLLLVAIVALAAGAFDIREAQHQANESRQTVLALAIVAATLHFGVAALAFATTTPMLRRRSG